MRDSERYEAQARTVLKLVAKAGSTAERQVYVNIANGWKQLAAEARRNESQPTRAAEERPFRPECE